MAKGLKVIGENSVRCQKLLLLYLQRLQGIKRITLCEALHCFPSKWGNVQESGRMGPPDDHCLWTLGPAETAIVMGSLDQAGAAIFLEDS